MLSAFSFLLQSTMYNTFSATETTNGMIPIVNIRVAHVARRNRFSCFEQKSFKITSRLLFLENDKFKDTF